MPDPALVQVDEAEYDIYLLRAHYNHVRLSRSFNYLPTIECAKRAAENEKSHQSSSASLRES